MGVAAAKANGAAAVARMKAMPTDDDAFGRGSIREDGRGLFPAYLFEVKTPGREQGPVGLLQAGRDHPRQRGLAPAVRGWLPPGAQLRAMFTIFGILRAAAVRPVAARA